MVFPVRNKKIQVLRNAFRRIRVRIAITLLKSDPGTVQRFWLILFVALLVPGMIYGWAQARWAGMLTGFVWVSFFLQLVLFVLGIAKESRPENTSIGTLQRKFIWPFILSALAGGYYGGWARGWLWTPSSIPSPVNHLDNCGS